MNINIFFVFFFFIKKKTAEENPIDDPEFNKRDEKGHRIIPHWLAQPYIRKELIPNKRKMEQQQQQQQQASPNKLKSPLKSPLKASPKKEEDLFVKKELDDGEKYVTAKDIAYMKKVFNPKINSKITIDSNKRLSKRDNGEFTYIESSDCYKYVPSDIEPESVSTILKHVNQLVDIINKYKDVIYVYQGTFVGKWGEMHSTSHALSLKTNTAVMRALNQKLDSSIYLAVRTPCHYRALTSEIKKLSESEYKKLVNRLSLFNDGLFYSRSDTGTYGSVTCFDDDEDMLYVKKSREEEVEFQNDLCLLVPNGGEVISNTNEDKYEEIYEAEDIKACLAEPDNYNNFYVCEDHSRNIHLSYYNEEYDIALYKRWDTTFSKQTYQPDWQGVSGENYMKRHLGYRYVLNETSFSNNTLSISLTNVGFAPSYRSFQTELLMKSTSSSGDTISITIDKDSRSWPVNKKFTFYVDIDNLVSKLLNDDYDVYLNLYDPNIDYDIRFANTNKYNEDYGYKIGQFLRT